MPVTIDVARTALRRAIEIRKRMAIPMDHAVNVVDLADQLNVEVWYMPLPSLSGMYAGGDDPRILIGSDRPPGYQASTCAHELGHHVFDHGTRVDEYIDGVGHGRKDDPEEAVTNLFASHLLMPGAAVARVFAVRGWGFTSTTPEQVFCAAGHLGVGYRTLVQHMRWTLRLISGPSADRLLSIQPQAIRARLFGQPLAENLFVVDHHWTERAVDMVVGDAAVLPPACRVEGTSINLLESSPDRVVIRARRRGISRVESSSGDWSAFVRVMPQRYEGAGAYRHLEDPDEP